METNIWQSAWESGRIGFHQDHVHPDLERFGAQWLGESPCQVLVPLCGKTLDLAWLVARGHTTVGVELVSQAVHELHTEQRRAHKRGHRRHRRRQHAHGWPRRRYAKRRPSRCGRR